MELRQLEYFQAANQHKSITKAAEHFHIAQPAVTIAIKKLEEELGVTLFDRSKKQIILTAEGRIFAQRVNEILSRVQDTVKEMKDFSLTEKGTIKIGVPPMIGAFLFPQIFAKFKEAYPQLELIVIEAGTLSIRSKVERGELEIGIIMFPNTLPQLDSILIYSGQILVCLPEGHHLAHLPRVEFSQLRNEPFILFNEDTYNRQLILEECKKQQFKPRIILSTSQIETICSLVEQGMGISFLLDAVTQKKGRLISRPLVDPLLIEIRVVWERERYLGKAAKSFINFIASTLAT